MGHRWTRVGVAAGVALGVTALLVSLGASTWVWVPIASLAAAATAAAWLWPVPEPRIVVHEPTYATRQMRPLPGIDDAYPATQSGTVTYPMRLPAHSASVARSTTHLANEPEAGPTGRFAYISLSNEGTADSDEVAPYLDFFESPASRYSRGSTPVGPGPSIQP